MPDSERVVATMANAFRHVFEDEDGGRSDERSDPEEDRTERQQQAVVAASGAALCDARSLANLSDEDLDE